MSSYFEDFYTNKDENYYYYKAHNYKPNQAISRSFEWIPDLEGKRILDVGCGGGMYAIPLAQKAKEVVGIDASKNSIKYATLLKERLGIKNVEFHCCDLFDYKAFEEFDAAICVTVLMHIKELEGAVRKIGSFLKPNGLLILSEPNKYFHRNLGALFYKRKNKKVFYQTFGLKQLRKILENGKFEIRRESGRIFSVFGIRRTQRFIFLQMERFGSYIPFKYLGEHYAIMARKLG